MNNNQIKRFFSDRVPLSGTLSDYALLIGQNNRVLTSRAQLITQSTTFGPKPNRVALNVGLTLAAANMTTILTVIFNFLDASGNIVWAHILFIKEADVAAVTPSPFTYNPLFLNVDTFGPLIQNSYQILITGNIQASVNEVEMMPQCCEYIGGMSGSDYPNRMFDPKSNEPLE